MEFIVVVLIVSYALYVYADRVYLRQRWQLTNDQSFDWKAIAVSAGWIVNELQRTEFPDVAVISLIKTINCNAMGPTQVTMTINGRKIKILFRNWNGRMIEQQINDITFTSITEWEKNTIKKYWQLSYRTGAHRPENPPLGEKQGRARPGLWGMSIEFAYSSLKLGQDAAHYGVGLSKWSACSMRRPGATFDYWDMEARVGIEPALTELQSAA